MNDLATARRADGSPDEEVWLLGQPTLRDYLAFVRDTVKGGAAIDPARLTDEWRAANDHYHELEQREPGIADEVDCRDLDLSLAPLAEEVAAAPCYRRTFNSLPTTFGMVELDRLVVSQRSVTATFVEALRSRLGPSPDPEALFRFCLPVSNRDAPVRIERAGSRRYVFRSESTDFRFHEPVLLRPDQVRDYQAFGPVAGIVGLVVGFGSNFLNVIRVDSRLLLHNGYHRACALRALGITHAPCIIQTVTRSDELDIAASAAVARDPAFYFQSARPPLLKDFFDPAIRRAWPVHRQARSIEVNFEVRDYMVHESVDGTPR
ncbi:hypothetical protein HY251_19435 [bacterium]|nr:hypothetical protein [bacterium]